MAAACAGAASTQLWQQLLHMSDDWAFAAAGIKQQALGQVPSHSHVCQCRYPCETRLARLAAQLSWWTEDAVKWVSTNVSLATCAGFLCVFWGLTLGPCVLQHSCHSSSTNCQPMQFLGQDVVEGVLLRLRAI
jgi:hypothetical protein